MTISTFFIVKLFLLYINRHCIQNPVNKTYHQLLHYYYYYVFFTTVVASEGTWMYNYLNYELA